MTTKTLILYSAQNHPGKHDATGAFIPEARAFASRYDVPDENILALDCIKNNPYRRRMICGDFFNQHLDYDVGLIGIFCHGWSSGIQIGFSKTTVKDLVYYLDYSCARDVRIVLYCCSTASKSKSSRKMALQKIAPGTDGGFADTLRDEMLRQGFRRGWVDAHLTPGHTTWNPYVVRFLNNPMFDDDIDLPGGQWLIQPKSKLWPEWRHALKTEFRFEFPMLEDYEIMSCLNEGIF